MRFQIQVQNPELAEQDQVLLSKPLLTPEAVEVEKAKLANVLRGLGVGDDELAKWNFRVVEVR